ncbi:GDSL-type esterase/lipase family protein [Actinoplanes sp. NBRC 101535]|uniref:GDSL-type esterase/lipase family protein n=1 Tax=Actinoplanes sp. NBRC 101535 TaxID=3032196 RepID=UPI0024A13F78|nr:GDSL-type esterase/lipase family protein [Actinoplanes sp. NBRC 101535]GLY03958.1 lipase [Actinoplanes sp. NBRC 101535]
MIITPITAELIRGAAELEETGRGVRPHRLPAWAREQGDDPQLSMVEAETSGVRLEFRTRASVIELEALPTRRGMIGMPQRPKGVYDLVVDGRLAGQATVDDATFISIDMTTGARTVTEAAPGTIRFGDLGDTLKDVVIWLPYLESTELVELRTDEPVLPAPAGDRPVWLHHGSSISHGSNAANPTGVWPAIAAAAAGHDLINLGLGGSAMVDPFTARTIRDTPADLISVKLGINVVNADAMRMRAFRPAVHGFLDTVRDGHPDTPLLVVSPILCPIHEDTPGPGAIDVEALRAGELKYTATGQGQLTLRMIRAELARIVAQRAEHDHHLYYLDGLDLYGEPDATRHPLPDRLHPDTATHRLIGERFTERAPATGWRPA